MKKDKYLRARGGTFKILNISCAGCGAPEGEQHMPNCPIEAPNVGGKRRAVGTSA